MNTAIVDDSKDWTVDDYLKLREGLLAQLIDGNLIMLPAPNIVHQEVLGKLFMILKSQLAEEVFFSPVDLYLDNKNVLQPDLVFISQERSNIISNPDIEGIPDLVVEIISINSRVYDRNTKRIKYMELGVSEYWIIDPDYQSLKIYHPKSPYQPESYFIKEGIVTSDASESINFNLKELF